MAGARILFMQILNHTLTLFNSERWRATLGALIGMGMCSIFLHAINGSGHWVLVPLAGTIVILYVQPHSPVAQPWPVLGSYMVSCLVGFICSLWLAPAQLAVTVSIALSIWLMVRFRCIHPPGAAMALLIVLDGPHSNAGMVQLAVQVVLNLGIALGSTLLVSNFILRRPYPYHAQEPALSLHRTQDDAPLQRIGLAHEDLASALAALDTFVDVQEDELVEIYNLAVDHAFGRHVGLTCADIMSRDVMTVHFDTDLEQAWNLLRLHKIKSLPVVDAFGNLIGIATVADFLRQMDDTSAAGLAVRLQGLLRRTPGLTSEKAEVVGQIMTVDVFTATPQTPVAKLVARVSDKGMAHIPVVDDGRKVVGIVTQSDMLAALYKRLAMSEAVPRV